MINQYKHVVFKPWIGKNFGKDGKKILALGDSFYCDGCDAGECYATANSTCSNKTTDGIHDYFAFLEGKPNNNYKFTTYTKFAKLIAGNKNLSTDGRKEIWDNIAFFNFIQTASLDQPRKSYPTKLYLDATEACKEVLEDILPDIVFCWGSKVWDFPALYEWQDLGDDEYSYGVYTIKGKKVLWVLIPHPSSYFSYDKWIPFVQKVLTM